MLTSRINPPTMAVESKSADIDRMLVDSKRRLIPTQSLETVWYCQLAGTLVVFQGQLTNRISGNLSEDVPSVRSTNY